MRKRIAVVGAGVGGLSTALRLARRGLEVDVYEKLPECGGRAHMIEDNGFKFDTGPSFVMMPDFFDELFSYCGEHLKEHLRFKGLDVHYKIFYPDNETFTVHRDRDATESELERIEPGSAKAYRRFLSDVSCIYDKVTPMFYNCYTPSAAFNPAHWRFLAKMKLHQTYWQLIKKYFKSDKLCYAFTFESMFVGVSPFSAPSFYSVIAYADHVHKIFHSLGGMYQIPRVIESLAKDSGVRFYYDSEISSVKKSGDDFALTGDKVDARADKVVLNADYAHSYQRLLGRRLPKFDYSCSVYLMYWGMKKKIANLEHHNLFFARDLRANLSDIFKYKRFPGDFSFYIHVPTVTDRSLAPEGKDILYVLVPVPNLQGESGSSTENENRIRKAVINRVNALCGENVEGLIETEHRFYPKDFITRYNIQYGATFGLAHTLLQSGFLRPANRDRSVKGLYYAGASTQPGGGLPPVIASSRIVADLITGSLTR